jgi:hypothetical protein
VLCCAVLCGGGVVWCGVRAGMGVIEGGVCVQCVFVVCVYVCLYECMSVTM